MINKPKYRALRLRLLLLVAIAMLPLYFLIITSYLTQIRNNRENVINETNQIVKIASSTHEGLLDSTEQFLIALSHHPTVEQGLSEPCNEFFKTMLQAQGQQRYANLGVIDLEGNIFCSGVPQSQATNVSDRLYYKRAIESKGFSIGEYIIGRLTGKPSVNVAYPVLDKDGEISSVVYAAIDLSWVNSLATTLNLPDKSTINLLDENYTVLVRYPNTEEWIGKNVAGTGVSKALANATNDSGTVQTSGLDGEERVYSYQIINIGGSTVTVTAGYPVGIITSGAWNLLKRNLLILGLFTIITLLIASYLAERLIIKPAKKLDEVEDKLNAQAEKDAAILASLGEGLIATDESGRIVLINKPALSMLGFDKDKLIGAKVTEKLILNDDKGEELPESHRPMFKALTNNEKIQGVYEYVLNSNKKLPVSITVTPIVIDGKVKGAIEIFRDISKEREIDKMKSEFISLASHQLKTPLTAMRWYSELMLNNLAGKLTAKQREYVSTIHNANLRMNELVNTLLNISRIESGRLMIQPKPTNIKSLVQELIKEIQPKLDEKKHKLQLSYDNKIPELVIDPSLLRQIYLNLLTNAIKYSKDGSLIKLAISLKDKVVESSVTDQGFGIPKEEEHRIFQKFYRGSNIVKLGSEGSGLGLYLIKIIVESFNGKIWFDSSDKGTTFYFTTPLTGMHAKKGEVSLS